MRLFARLLLLGSVLIVPAQPAEAPPASASDSVKRVLQGDRSSVSLCR
jgi:hypothetical protein